jgi:Calpain family cysteine protease
VFRRVTNQRSQVMILTTDKCKNEFSSNRFYDCRLCGSYEALCGGLTSEALTDFTGGIVQRFEIATTDPKQLWQTMVKASSKKSLMGCSIDVSKCTTSQSA